MCENSQSANLHLQYKLLLVEEFQTQANQHAIKFAYLLKHIVFPMKTARSSFGYLR